MTCAATDDIVIGSRAMSKGIFFGESMPGTLGGIFDNYQAGRSGISRLTVEMWNELVEIRACMLWPVIETTGTKLADVFHIIEKQEHRHDTNVNMNAG
jgi:hypothetical protein